MNYDTIRDMIEETETGMSIICKPATIGGFIDDSYIVSAKLVSTDDNDDAYCEALSAELITENSAPVNMWRCKDPTETVYLATYREAVDWVVDAADMYFTNTPDDNGNRTPWIIDTAMTGETHEIAERACEILIEAGWNVEFDRYAWNGAPDQPDHAYYDLPAFDAALWAAVQQASNELSAPLTVAECANLYHMNVSSVRLACKEGRVEATKFGRAWQIDRASAEAYWGKRRNR